MAFSSIILSDTKTHAKVLLSYNNDNALRTGVDASTLSGWVTNVSKLNITHIIYGITGCIQLQFQGTSDITAIDIVGSGTYYGAVIKNTATMSGSTAGDIRSLSAPAAYGFILLTLQKIGFAENA